MVFHYRLFLGAVLVGVAFSSPGRTDSGGLAGQLARIRAKAAMLEAERSEGRRSWDEGFARDVESFNSECGGTQSGAKQDYCMSRRDDLQSQNTVWQKKAARLLAEIDAVALEQAAIRRALSAPGVKVSSSTSSGGGPISGK